MSEIYTKKFRETEKIGGGKKKREKIYREQKRADVWLAPMRGERLETRLERGKLRENEVTKGENMVCRNNARDDLT